MSIRDQRQKEFANAWLKTKKGILYLCPRFGKIYTTINILEQLPSNASVLIAYPDVKIKESWEADFETRGYDVTNITYTTHLSMKKFIDQKFDVVVIDEIHLLSEAQLEAASDIIAYNKVVLGLTGTLSKDTEETLRTELGLKVIATYSMEQAINEGVIVDYQITVHYVPLDNIVKIDYKGKIKTEKKQFESYGWVINTLMRAGKETMFLRLARMRLIQSSIAKVDKTKALLKKYNNERILVFCGVTKIADSLGIPSYHNKSSEKNIFSDFVSGEGKHMAVVKIGNTGVTYKPLNRIIVNYFDSNGENMAQKINRCMAMEYSNPDKKAYIDIVCSTEDVEQKWLNKALEFFDKTKIKHI